MRLFNPIKPAAWLLLVFLSGFAWARAELRLGIWCPEEITRVPADLLTEAFSKEANLALVERSEIDRVFREQSLAATAKTDFTRFGSLLRADGLVMLQTIRSATATNLAVRLVAVNSGVVLDGALYPLPLANPTQWAKSVQARFSPWFTKLAVPRSRAVPLSIISLRSAVNTSAAVETEQRLTALLFHRLMAERELFVLERRQLGKLAWEKDLAGPDAEPFWNGAYLIEGVVDRDGAAPQTVSIHAQIVPPNHSAALQVNVAADRQKPAEVIEQLASGILKVLQLQSTVTSWNPEHEAERFEEQAAWALRWKSRHDAFAAADAAYGLGRRTEKVAGMKLQALQLPIHSNPKYTIDVGTYLIAQDARHPDWVFDRVRKCGWNENPPAPEELSESLEALRFFHQHCLSIESNRWQTNAVWLALGIDAVHCASEVLRHHYFYGWRKNQFDPTLPELREAIRTVFQLLPPSACSTNLRIIPSDLPRVTRTQLLGRWGALWQETPQDAIKVYQQLLANEDYPSERRDLLLLKILGLPKDKGFARLWIDPFWVGWTVSDREQGAVLWQNFVSLLLASTNRTWHAEGALLKLHAAFLDPDIALATEEFYDATMDENHRRFTTEIDLSLLDAFDGLLKSKGQKTLRRERLFKAWESLWFARLKHYLQTTKKYDLWRDPPGRFYSPEQAKELIPVVEDYKQRFPQIGDRRLQSLRQWASRPWDEFSSYLSGENLDSERIVGLVAKHEKDLTPEDASLLAEGLTGFVQRFDYATEVREVIRRLERLSWAAYAQPAKPKPSLSSQAAFEDVVCFAPVGKGPVRAESDAPAFVSLIQHGDTMYAAILGPSTVKIVGRTHYFYRSASVVAMDLVRGTCKELVEDFPWGPQSEKKFEFFEDGIYWIHKDESVGQYTLRRYALNSGAIRTFHVDVPLNNASLRVSGGRFFISSREFIAEFFPRDESLKLLASMRRRPAANPLDEWKWPGKPKLEFQQDGSLMASFRPRKEDMFRYGYKFGDQLSTNADPVAWVENAPGQWQPLASPLTELENRYRLKADQFANPFQNKFSVWLDPGPPRKGKLEILFSDYEPLMARWPLPPNHMRAPQLLSVPDLYDGTNAWMLAEPLPGSSNTFSTLLWFDPKWELPWRIPLKGVNRPLAHCLKVPSGLVLFPEPFSQCYYFYFLPRKALEKWIASHTSPARNLPRREPEVRRKFDLNGDGLLDPQEIKSMQADQEWCKADLAYQARRFLLTFDLNEDDRLDKAEITAFLETKKDRDNSPFRSMSRYMPRVLSLEVVLSDYDQNRDGMLDADEAKKFYLAEVASTFSNSRSAFGDRSSNQNAYLPSSLRKYDHNGNGKLDAEEMAEWKRDRQKAEDASALRSRTNNSPRMPANP